MKHLPSIIIYLSISSLLFSPPPTKAHPPSESRPSPPSIQSTAVQQLLATVSPGAAAAAQPFLTSPSATHAAYLLRSPAGDSCYVQVQDTATGQSAWESPCAPVGGDNACALAFSDAGLAVLDGDQPAWSVAASAGTGTVALEVTDDGYIVMTSEEGLVVWKSSEEASADQGCAAAVAPAAPSAQQPGSTGISPAAPSTQLPGSTGLSQGAPNSQQPGSTGAAEAAPAPVGGGGSSQLGLPAPSTQQPGTGGQASPASAAGPVGGGNLPFGRAAAAAAGGEQALKQTSGIGGQGQPLVDNTPFDSGVSKGVKGWLGLGLLLLSLVHGLMTL